MRINTLCPTHISDRGGPSYACQALLGAMNTAGADVRLHCVSSEQNVHQPFFRPSIPLWAKPLGYRLFSEETLNRYTEWRYLRSMTNHDIAYLWPGTSLETYHAIKSAGRILVTENVNTHQATSKQIMNAEYRRIGLTPDHGIDEKRILEESTKLELVDFVFSPGTEVTASLLNAGVAADKIIQTSYGCYEHEILMPDEVACRENRKQFTAIFVGRIGIRKGVHLLLDYWSKAGVNGTLKLVGRFEPAAMQLIEPYLKRHDVVHVPFTSDLRSVYLDADVMLLPSLEEGSPLVTYLALGAGLPSIVSPMGAGGIIKDGDEGIVIDPYNTDEWIESIRKVCHDTDYRRRLSENAYKRSASYTWNNVGKHRIASLQALLEKRSK